MLAEESRGRWQRLLRPGSAVKPRGHAEGATETFLKSQPGAVLPRGLFGGKGLREPQPEVPQGQWPQPTTSTCSFASRDPTACLSCSAPPFPAPLPARGRVKHDYQVPAGQPPAATRHTQGRGRLPGRQRQGPPASDDSQGRKAATLRRLPPVTARYSVMRGWAHSTETRQGRGAAPKRQA